MAASERITRGLPGTFRQECVIYLNTHYSYRLGLYVRLLVGGVGFSCAGRLLGVCEELPCLRDVVGRGLERDRGKGGSVVGFVPPVTIRNLGFPSDEVGERISGVLKV
ncbi:hypothetical protein NDU88_010175 [Pleurodeles waltl]|uniref:Uncharacterized protein n=1 Tax=Pleurodeles waltl TaxID=8319 RepID=A0AAV7QUZ0_PLEWA|nr:hypothetical protein NDU88_010175 [Pleurodeles waltl]